MIPKNGDLFTGLTRIERLFLRPNEYPWQALFRTLGYMVPHFLREDWAEKLFPCSHARERNDMELHHGVIEPFGSVHVRGGYGLKSDENARIKGPVVLGRNVILRKSAVVTGPCWIGDDVIIGHGCRIKSSILLPGAHIVFGTRVSRSIIGRNAEIGPSVTLADQQRRRDRDREITYWHPGSGEPQSGEPTINTRLTELGPIVGDDCEVLGGAILTPGVILKPETIVDWGAHLRTRTVYSGFVANES